MQIENNNLPVFTSITCIAIGLFITSFIVLRKLVLTPQDNRVYQDQLPKGFTLIWPVTRFLVHLLGQRIHKEWRKKTHARLCHAGADYILSPEQFIVAPAAIAIYLGPIFAILLHMAELWSVSLWLILTALGCYCPQSWLEKRRQRREIHINKIIPQYLDIITLSIESGTNLNSALELAIKKSKVCPLQEEFARVIRDIQSGKTKANSFKNLQYRVRLDCIDTFVGSILQADKTGASLGGLLKIQADQQRFERFARAEKLGMEAPVKLLGPLIMFIFPTTFIILFFLISIKLISTGIVTNPSIQFLLTNPLDLLQISGF